MFVHIPIGSCHNWLFNRFFSTNGNKLWDSSHSFFDLLRALVRVWRSWKQIMSGGVSLLAFRRDRIFLFKYFSLHCHTFDFDFFSNKKIILSIWILFLIWDVYKFFLFHIWTFAIFFLLSEFVFSWCSFYIFIAPNILIFYTLYCY